MAGDRAKKLKVTENPEEVDAELILSIEKLQEIQDDLEKVYHRYLLSFPLFNYVLNSHILIQLKL
jgi:hypothetical protein